MIDMKTKSLLINGVALFDLMENNKISSGVFEAVKASFLSGEVVSMHNVCGLNVEVVIDRDEATCSLRF